MRVYEIAKEVGIPNKDLIAKIRALGLEVNNHMSSLDADDVARIKRSLEKERQAVVQPAQTQKLSSGTVLRRRSSGEKAAETTGETTPVRVREDRPVERERPVERPAAPAPVIRRRVATPDAPPPPAAEPPAPPPPRVSPPVAKERPAPPPPPPTPPAEPPIAARDGTKQHVVKPEAPPAVETPVTAPPPPVERPAEAPAPAERPARSSRVIVNGPQIVARTNERRAPERAPEPEPPASTPLPPRAPVTRVEAQSGGPGRTVEQVAEGARSRFELELERAKARTAERGGPEVIITKGSGSAPRPAAVAAGSAAMGEQQQQTEPTRDPARPAVGTVIALPPRIKITERTPAVGRPAPGQQPVNPIRGRFAQQQQQKGGGRPMGNRPGQGGMMDMRKKLPLGKKGKQTQLTTPAEHKRVIRIEDTIAISDLARAMSTKAPDVLKKLWGMGMTGININASIDFETAQILASEFGYEVQNVAFKEEDAFAQKVDDSEKLAKRAPVVTVMGHVDHGKTSLLDAIRKTRVAAGEAGGITQHIAAYKVSAGEQGEIVFLDTPGHEAFTEMRARGAQATDIVVLVVAANDGVMPQTVEALSHAKDAGVKIIVAVNKIDLPDAQPERVRQQLADHALIPEEWGGDTIYVNVSALKQQNIDGLLQQIAAVADGELDLRANPDKPATGVVIEARLDRNRGPMATVLIQEGTLRIGDIVVAGRTFGKVRAMLDDRGENLEEAGPSTPIEVLGLDGVPEAGDQVNGAEDEKVAKQVVEHRRQQYRKRELQTGSKRSLESMMERMAESGETKELKIVLKADVQGSAEALKAALTKLTTEKVKVSVTMAGVGGITESDVNFAKAGGAIVVGFHVRPAGKSTKLAEQEDVEIRLYDIIYDALDDVKAAMAGLLAPIKREVAMGKLDVRQTYSIPKIGTVAGCMVTEGKITRKAHLRIVRDAVQVYEGKVGSLRRFKDDVSEVQHGFECGVMVAGWNEIKQGDIIEAYEVIEEAAQL